MTLYHLTPEGPRVALSYQLESRRCRGRGKTNDSDRERERERERERDEEEEKNGVRIAGKAHRRFVWRSTGRGEDGK